jgi:hypothetical protein
MELKGEEKLYPEYNTGEPNTQNGITTITFEHTVNESAEMTEI